MLKRLGRWWYALPLGLLALAVVLVQGAGLAQATHQATGGAKGQVNAQFMVGFYTKGGWTAGPFSGLDDSEETLLYIVNHSARSGGVDTDVLILLYNQEEDPQGCGVAHLTPNDVAVIDLENEFSIGDFGVVKLVATKSPDQFIEDNANDVRERGASRGIIAFLRQVKNADLPDDPGKTRAQTRLVSVELNGDEEDRIRDDFALPGFDCYGGPGFDKLGKR